MNQTYVQDLLKQIKVLTTLGCKVMPAIKDESNPTLTTGKVPSSIKPDGKTTLMSGRTGWSTESLTKQIALAKTYCKPIGIAVQPPEGLVIIDLDANNYRGNETELLADYHRLVSLYPDLANTRTEKTTNGGLHVYIRVDDLEEWKRETGSLRKNLTTTLGGPHRGELLSTNSVCIAAPSYEQYTFLDCTPADKVITVPSLAAISIFTTYSRSNKDSAVQPITTGSSTHQPTGVLLRDLLGIKALGVLQGQYAYSDPNSPKKDRSLQLAGFAKEAFGCENLANQYGFELAEGADELISAVIKKFDLTSKAERILSSIQLERHQYKAGNEQAVLKTLGIPLIQISGRKSNITADIAQEEAIKVLGTVREQIRTGNLVFGDGRVLTRDDLDAMYMEFSKTTQYYWNKVLAKDAVQAIGRDNRYDHIQEEFIQLADTATPLPDAQWNRLDQLLFGIDDPIAAMFMPKYLVGAVTRLMKPGCPYVATPTLVGGQGIGKSASAKVLFGHQYVVDELGYSLTKDDISRAHRFFCTELSEVDGITGKADRERLKNFLTQTTDVYRPPYGQSEIVCPRRFVFWATSNGSPLIDPTGNRRFVSIDLRSKTKQNRIPLAQIQQYRAAIWARAFYEYHQGTCYELNASEQAIVNNQNDLFTVGDSWVDRLTSKLSKDSAHTCLTIDEAFTILEIPAAQQTATLQKRLREVLVKLDYQAAKVTLPSGQRATRFTRSKGRVQKPINVAICMG